MFVVVERRNAATRSTDGLKLEKDCFQMEMPIELSGSEDEEHVSAAIDHQSNHESSNGRFCEEDDEDTHDAQIPTSALKLTPSNDSKELDEGEENARHGDPNEEGKFCFHQLERKKIHETNLSICNRRVILFCT